MFERNDIHFQLKVTSRVSLHVEFRTKVRNYGAGVKNRDINA